MMVNRPSPMSASVRCRVCDIQQYLYKTFYLLFWEVNCDRFCAADLLCCPISSLLSDLFNELIKAN